MGKKRMRGRKKSLELDIKAPRRSTSLEPSTMGFPTAPEEPKLSPRQRLKQAKAEARKRRRIVTPQIEEETPSTRHPSKVEEEHQRTVKPKQSSGSTGRRKGHKKKSPKQDINKPEPTYNPLQLPKKRKTRSDKGVKRGPRKKKPPKQLPYYPSEEDIVLDNLVMLLDMLENADTSWGYTRNGQITYKRIPDVQMESEKSRVSLIALLKDQITQYGAKIVGRRLESIANTGELNALVETMLHGYYIEQIRSSYQRLANIIKGSMLSEEETKYWGDIDSGLDGDYEPE